MTPSPNDPPFLAVEDRTAQVWDLANCLDVWLVEDDGTMLLTERTGFEYVYVLEQLIAERLGYLDD